MKKGDTLTFKELYNWLQEHQDYNWRLIAVGGTFWYLSQYVMWKAPFKPCYFEVTDSGVECFVMRWQGNEEGDFRELSFGNYSDLNYRIEVYNDEPLEILIEWRETYDINDEHNESEFYIFRRI